MKPRDRNTDAAEQPLNQPPEVDILDRGRANNCLADPILKLWIQANAPPFYAILLFWFQNYFLDLHHPNIQFKDQKQFDPRHLHRCLPVFYFRRLSLMTQIQVATIAIVWSECGWLGNEDRDCPKVSSISLHIHESIDPLCPVTAQSCIKDTREGDGHKSFIGRSGSTSTVSLFFVVFGLICSLQGLYFSPFICIQRKLVYLLFLLPVLCSWRLCALWTLVYKIMLVHGRTFGWLDMCLAFLYVSHWQYYPDLALVDAHEPNATRFKDTKSVEMDCINRTADLQSHY